VHPEERGKREEEEEDGDLLPMEEPELTTEVGSCCRTDGCAIDCWYGLSQVTPPRQLCPRNSSLCSFIGKFPDLAVNFDRNLTDLGAILKNSGRYRRGG
jgi:hypothetical protein